LYTGRTVHYVFKNCVHITSYPHDHVPYLIYSCLLGTEVCVYESEWIVQCIFGRSLNFG